jgi:hypothetical protein
MADSGDNPDIESIRAHADAIIESGILGRSRFYRSLLEYLVDNAARGHIPKEVEIAADVFRRGNAFDPSQDSMVRVYVHNLRQKLNQHYQNAGEGESSRLTIPKGEYRIVLADRDPDTGRALVDGARGGRRFEPGRAARAALLVAVGLVGGLLLARWSASGSHPLIARYETVAASSYWAGMLDDDRPVVIVTGDYYIFGETDAAGNVDRLVREFEINSRRDLDELMLIDPGAASRYIDLSLTYLPSSAAAALRDILRVLYTTDKNVRVVTMSGLDAKDIRDSHVVYVGYLSGLDKLIDFVFMGSELAIGRTYDELLDTVTGASFQSEAGLLTGQRNYRDYGLVSVFPGPNGNDFLILAGTRDEGLMHSAFAVSDPGFVAGSLAAVVEELGEQPPAFEILYEVAGFSRTNLDAAIVHIARLRSDVIWTGELGLPE